LEIEMLKTRVMSRIYAIFAGVAVTDVLAWHYCSFLTSPTVLISTVATIVGAGVSGVVINDMLSNDMSKSPLFVAIGAATIIFGLPVLTEYNANTDMVQIIKTEGSGSTYVTKNTALPDLKTYSVDNPAGQFIAKFIMSTQHPTTFVWNNMLKRANYLSYLYTHHYLVKGDNTPHFGFVHANKNLRTDVMWYYNLKSRAAYSAVRQQGKTSRYVDDIIKRTQQVVYGRRTFFNHYAQNLDNIKSVRE
jgi:hypothetical protein